SRQHHYGSVHRLQQRCRIQAELLVPAASSGGDSALRAWQLDRYFARRDQADTGVVPSQTAQAVNQVLSRFAIVPVIAGVVDDGMESKPFGVGASHLCKLVRTEQGS